MFGAPQLATPNLGLRASGLDCSAHFGEGGDILEERSSPLSDPSGCT